MGVTIQWICDKDNASAQGDSAKPPEGWAVLSCNLSNAEGGVQGASLELCPACVASLGDWLGKPVFEVAVGANPVPIETTVPATDPGDPIAANPTPPPNGDTGGVSTEGVTP